MSDADIRPAGPDDIAAITGIYADAVSARHGDVRDRAAG